MAKSEARARIGEMDSVTSQMQSATSDVPDRAERNRAAVALIEEWLADESGYDEKVWPTIERDLRENPVVLGGHESK